MLILRRMWGAITLVLVLLSLQGGQARAGVPYVDIYALSYHPPLITITAGEAVTWFNFDRRVHTIISDTGAFYSGPIYPGRFFAVHFPTPGAYPYHDNLYPSYMRGVVIVNPPTTPAPPGPTPTPVAATVSNLATHKNARASDAQPANPPSAAFDGRGDTGWSNIPTGQPGFAHWLQVDLGSEQSFNQVVVNWGTAYADDYAIFVWRDNRWLEIAHQFRGNGGNDWVNFATVRSRHVRLWAFHSTDLTGLYRINEMAIYNQASAINLALDRPVAAQGYEGDGAPERAVDGDPNTAWAAPAVLPQFLSVDLQGSFAVERVTARWAPDRVPPAVSLYGYDNREWKLLDHRDPADGIDQTFVLSTTLVLSQVMIQAEPAGTIPQPAPPQTTTVGVALRELEVYGRAP